MNVIASDAGKTPRPPSVRFHGHVAFLPTLLELTPFEFVYLVSSDIESGYARCVNSWLSAQGHKPSRSWKTCEPDDLRNIRPESDIGLVLSLAGQDAERACLYIGQFVERNLAAPLVINVVGETVEEASSMLASLEGAIGPTAYGRNVDYLHPIPKTPFTPLAPPAPEGGIAPARHHERWIEALSSEHRFAEAVQGAPSQAVRYLFAQDLHHGPPCYEGEKQLLLSDHALKETYDRHAFRRDA